MNFDRYAAAFLAIRRGLFRSPGKSTWKTRALRWSLCLAMLASMAGRLDAHNLGQSYLYLQIYPETITGRFEIALSDLNPALGLSGSSLEITGQNLEERIGFLQDYYLEHVTISSDQGPLQIAFTEHELLNARGGYVLMSFDLQGFTEVPEVLTFDYSVLFDEEPNHRGFLLIEHNWATGTFANENQISLVFSPSSRQQDFDVQSSGRLQGFIAVVKLGAEHMWLGLDHVMFLVALLLPAVLRWDPESGWQPIDRFTPALINVVKIVMAFTVAHSVTLSLAALGVLHLPGRLVEVVIALSVALAAANILFHWVRERVWIAVFVFGLFHGFGFAGALSEMGVIGEDLGLSRLAFNLGVEVGQIVIVAILFPLFFLVRRAVVYQRIVLPVAAVTMILISSAWVVERAFGLDFQMTKRVRSLLGGLTS